MSRSERSDEAYGITLPPKAEAGRTEVTGRECEVMNELRERGATVKEVGRVLDRPVRTIEDHTSPGADCNHESEYYLSFRSCLEIRTHYAVEKNAQRVGEILGHSRSTVSEHVRGNDQCPHPHPERSEVTSDPRSDGWETWRYVCPYCNSTGGYSNRSSLSGYYCGECKRRFRNLRDLKKAGRIGEADDERRARDGSDSQW